MLPFHCSNRDLCPPPPKISRNEGEATLVYLYIRTGGVTIRHNTVVNISPIFCISSSRVLSSRSLSVEKPLQNSASIAHSSFRASPCALFFRCENDTVSRVVPCSFSRLFLVARCRLALAQVQTWPLERNFFGTQESNWNFSEKKARRLSYARAASPSDLI